MKLAPSAHHAPGTSKDRDCIPIWILIVLLVGQAQTTIHLSKKERFKYLKDNSYGHLRKISDSQLQGRNIQLVRGQKYSPLWLKLS